MREMAEEEGMGFYDLFIEFVCRQEPLILRDILDDLEANIIRKVLEKENGNIRRTASTLSVKYTTLFEKIKKHNIQLLKRSIC
jgi:transcriptional regulator with PAS, ATPase and Fis domain